MNQYRGKIVEFRGSFSSGMAMLVINDRVRGVVSVPCENAPTVRALDACFGNVIGAGHTVRSDGGHIGQDIFYSIDDLGILVGFTRAR